MRRSHTRVLASFRTTENALFAVHYLQEHGISLEELALVLPPDEASVEATGRTVGRAPSVMLAESPISTVSQVGALVGEGSFAIDLTAAAFRSSNNALSDALDNVGFTPGATVLSLINLSLGGALVVVDATPLGPGLTKIERILNGCGADRCETVRLGL